MRVIHSPRLYNGFLLLVAGLGGLLYGIDVGVIAGALPYLEATSGFNASQISFIVAAVLAGSVLSTLLAGVLADWLGRKRLMILGGLLFVASIPTIALAQGYTPLVLGRLLQGVSAGLIGVVVPLYLAECLNAANRGKGTGVFQWLLTVGIVSAALIGMYFSYRLSGVAATGDAARILAFKDQAWRDIFWVSLPPGALFVLGSFMLTESPRWLFRKGRVEHARMALLRSRTPELAALEIQEMTAMAHAEAADARRGQQKDSLRRRKYVVPFLLTCGILACNQTTGINSIIGYSTEIFMQGGLSDVAAHWGYVIITLVSFVATIGALVLVDRKGRKFLLAIGTAGIVASLTGVGLTFHRAERSRIDVGSAVQKMVHGPDGEGVVFSADLVKGLLGSADSAGKVPPGHPVTLTIIYSYGDFHGATTVFRSDDLGSHPIAMSREGCVPHRRLIAWLSHPLADFDRAQTAPIHIDHALITPVPSRFTGWVVALLLFSFMAFFAIGPGVCVWLALSELMPTRIRSNGMSLALLVNQTVSAVITAVFLPTVGEYGYAATFLFFAGCTAVYFLLVVFLLPETKGKTLEEIEQHFEGTPTVRADAAVT